MTVSKKTLVLINEMHPFMEKVLKYNFKNADLKVIPYSYTPFDREDLAKIINEKYKQVIFYGYENQFYLLLPLISKKVVKKYIIDVGIAPLALTSYLNSLLQIIEYKDRGLIDYLGTTRYDLYSVMKNQMSFIIFDYKNNKKRKSENSIGILNEYYLNEANFYNQLSAVAMSKIKCARVLDQNIITKEFGKDFEVKIIEDKNLEELVCKNKVNLDCRFCDISPIPFILSMDEEIPCVLGNTNLLDNNKQLKELLVLESDDNINEINEKIESSLKNKDKIIKLYSSWRKDYIKESKKSLEKWVKLGGL